MVGVYIHIPFCMKKCKYCDFVSFDNCKGKEKEYIKSLIAEMKTYKNVEADTIFIGGGTPTSLDFEGLEEVLLAIKKYIIISPNTEFTVEANPKTLNEEKLSMMKRYGVNRISLGVQSFSDLELLKIGRIHSSGEAGATIELIKKCGFQNFSIDLMSALPSQTLESFKKSLEMAVSYNPPHISCYSLILEDGTPLMEEYKNGELQLPDEDTERAMYEYACSFLEENGYIQYEISNFSKEGYKSRHNIKYWQCDEYIGIGLAAHSYYKGKRYQNTENLDEYISGNNLFGEPDELTLEDKISEFVIMGLRMIRGINKDEFYSRFRYDIYDIYGKELERFIKYGFMLDDGENIYLNRAGISLSNSIMCEFATCNLENPE